MSYTDTVRQNVKKWHSRLIELNRRNSLYSLPPSNRGVFSFQDIACADLFDHLSTPRRTVKFTMSGLAVEEDVRVHTVGTSIEIELSIDQFKRIDRLRITSAATFKEQGIVTLYLAFGVLVWYDAARRNDSGPVRSPLVLMPVQLTRGIGQESIVLTRLDDSLELNPTLVHRLSQSDLKIDLPALPDETKFPLLQYFDVLRTALKSVRNYEVLNEPYLGRFSFLKMAMYRDLQDNFEEACQHPIIAALSGNLSAITQLPLVPLSRLDELDERLKGYRSNSVLDADPTQQRAILAARTGQSFVLQGPPGTGKTQTIANIISECMAAGKRVLFVSQKMAALDAVFKRLTDKGLSDFCLELHSYKADKKKVVAQVKAAYEAQRAGANLDEYDQQSLDNLRMRLSNVVRAIHQVRQPLGKSIFEVNGIVARLHDTPDYPFALNEVELVDTERYAEMTALARRLAKHHSIYCGDHSYPWKGVKANRFSLDLKSQISSLLEGLLATLLELTHAARVITEACALGEAGCLSDCTSLVGIAELLAVSPQPPRNWLTDGNLSELRADAANHRAQQLAYHNAKNQLLERWNAEVLELNHRELLDILTNRYESKLKPLFGRAWQDAVPVRLSNLRNATEDLKIQSATCARTLQLINERLGLSSPPTISDESFLRDLCEIVCKAQHPLVDWFTIANVDYCKRLARAAQAECERVTTHTTSLREWYEDTLFEVDAAAVNSRFERDYTGIRKWFIPQYYADKRAIMRSLRPGVRRSLHQLEQDLRVLLNRQNGQQWLNEHRRDLTNAFGGYYNGVETDWTAICSCLNTQAELLQVVPNGTVTAEIVAMMSSGGIPLREFKDIFAQFCTQLDNQSACLNAVELQIVLDAIPPSDLPVKQVPLPVVNEYLTEVVEAAVHYTNAYMECGECIKTHDSVVAEGLVEMLQVAARVVETERAIVAEKDLLLEKYSGLYDGLETDWETVLSELDWTQRLCSACGTNTPAAGIIDVALEATSDTRQRVNEAALRTRELADKFVLTAPQLDDYFPAASITGVNFALDRAILPKMRLWIEERLSHLEDLESWIDFQNLSSECKILGLTSFYETIVQRKPDAQQVELIFEKRFHQLWYDAVLDREPILQHFRGESHIELIETFRDLDKQQIETAPARIRQSILHRGTTSNSKIGEAARVRKIVNAKRLGPIRKILSEIPNALFQYKPCILMSPLSVSQYLDAKVIQFDLVIFDEASQIFVEDSLCSLFRAKQVIIAGDTKQLPPTDFFLSLTSEDEDIEDAAASDSYESILQAAAGISGFVDRHMDPDGAYREAAHFAEHELLWHYRSKHESLIAFSRQHFYEKIVAFPAPTSQSAVTWRYVPNGVFYRGDRKRINPVEAQAIVDEVLTAATAYPDASIGVITFNEPQRNYIKQLIDLKIAQSPRLQKRLDESGVDGFFVKNIENVQGDERDVIFLGLGFGPDENGKLSMNFGPVNREGGERRLNVAITRARSRMIMVSSILPEQITLKTADSNGSYEGSKGLATLRRYLEYAQSGGQSLEVKTPEPSQFETAVAEAILELGYEVRANVGAYGYTVNIGIVHPERSGEYILGVECDGPTYRDAETVRSRDRLREEVLTNLGWKLHRVWSCDWVNNPLRELRKIDAAVQLSLNPPKEAQRPPARRRPLVQSVVTGSTGINDVADGPQNSQETASTDDSPQFQATLRADDQLPGTTHFVLHGIEVTWHREGLYGTSGIEREQVADLVQQLLELNGPMLERSIMSLAARCVGIERVGPRVEAALSRAISTLITTNKIERRLGFLYPCGIDKYPARLPRRDESPRPVTEICDEELAEIVLAVLRVAIGERNDELVQDTARALGYQSTSSALADRIQRAISSLELAGRISSTGGQIRAL